MSSKKVNIIGAGAAGLISALYLRPLAELSITVYEKQARDVYRSAPCSGGISLEKLSRIKAATGFDSSPYISRRVKGIKTVFPNGRECYLYKEACTVDKTRWQRGMIRFLEKRGVDLKFNCEVKGSNKIKKLSEESDILIGAEGPNSETSRYIGNRKEFSTPVHYKMNLNNYDTDFLDFYVDKDISDKYMWVFPEEGYFSVGTAGNFKSLERFIKKQGLEGEIIGRETYPIAYGGQKFADPEEGVLLTGDAAGIANPVTEGGLGPIVVASEILAECVKTENNGGAIERYMKKMNDHLIAPKNWRGKVRLVYSNNTIQNIRGWIFDHEDIEKPSLRALGKIAMLPPLWYSIYRLRKTMEEMKQFF